MPRLSSARGNAMLVAASIYEACRYFDATVKRVRPDGWRDVQAREQVIKRALYTLLQDVADVERIFLSRQKAP